MTTDITELAQSLKAAAEKATSGEWAVQFGDEVYVTNDDVGYEQVAIATLDARDADYIALANPANILALVEALEKAQADGSEYAASERAEAVKNVALQDEIYGLKSRIAELESRTVTVKQYDEFQIFHYGATEDYAKGYIDCQNNFSKWLTAAGIKWEAE
ncbi:ead/Ea22-like family protein [Raoultella ornithinolytica]|uniref:ead/Ea22-like family protein n=1 Tax=Raoultella ornithinolytica TaxID=54291 RepID=UPI003850B4DC